MSNHSNTPVDVDPAALNHAHEFWGGFTFFVKYGIIALVVLLGLMFAFLL